MNGAELLVPILVPLGAFAMVFGIIYLRTRENMAMIEKGMNPKAYANRPAPYRNLKSGLLFLGAGIGLLIAFFLEKNIGGSDNEPIYFWDRHERSCELLDVIKDSHFMGSFATHAIVLIQQGEHVQGVHSGELLHQHAILLHLLVAVSDVDHLTICLACRHPLDQEFQVLISLEGSTAPLACTDAHFLRGL